MLKHRPAGSWFSPNSTRANILWATATQSIEKLAGYAVIAVLARTLLQAELGTVFFALTVAELCATLVNFGTDHYLVRAVATDRAESLGHLSAVLSARLQNTLTGFVLLNLGFLAVRPELAPVLLLVSASDFLEEIYYCFSAFFAGRKVLIYRLAISGVFRLFSVAVLSGVALATRELMPVLWTRLLLSAVLVVVTAAVVRRRFGAVKLSFDPRASLGLMRLSAPFFVVNFLTMVHMRFDTILVGVFVNLSQVAIYELGIKMLEAARFIIRPLNSVFYPVFSEYAARGQWKKLRLRFAQLAAVTFGGGLALAAAMQVFGPQVIVWLFGANYVESAAPARVLFLSLPFVYFNFVATVVANGMRLERQAALWLVGAVILNLSLNIRLIPAFGILGAAWATVISQTGLALAMLAMISTRLLRPLPVSAGAAPRDPTPPAIS